MPVPQRIIELVENFKQNFNYYQSNEYNEEQLRTEFLNPFFEVLGWDMENKLAKGADRDVHYEKLVHGKAPDFGFYLDKKLRFFVEAKKPALNVCSNQDAALQLRGYGWSAKTARSILTDFEELSIYDTAIRPKSSDAAKIARLDCIKFTEYVERWDEIAGLFSREAVLGGSLEKLTKKRAQQAVDDELLDDISKWRELLAHNIANRNKIPEERLNRIVQDSIARILFLRICEDRGIAHEGELSNVIEGEDNYKKLYKLFKKAEQRYDSDLFEVESIADLKIDDKVLKEVISELYFPKSPYKFDAIPAEILGQVYEQFLGKVIRLTEGGHARVELKPEVRKAGGIYYTPTYIVEYIVKNTVGKLVEGKTPKQIEKLSIVDPACGSGSFLLGAYKFLADWYRDWYVADNAVKHQKASKIYRDESEQWQLTLEEKKRILTAHIYGVDLDRQAVEMAKLSLMLEALSSPEQQSLFNDRMLPRLGDNIKCGNSLIGTNYFTGQDISDPAALARINPFDWEIEFKDVFSRGGFDAVIGNPPYVRPKNIPVETKKAIWKTYQTFVAKSDLYSVFIEKGINISKLGGEFSFIVPKTWTSLESFSRIRRYILSNVNIECLTQLPKKVFQKATVETCIFRFERTESPTKENEIVIESLDSGGKVTFVRNLQLLAIEQSHLYNFNLDSAATGDALLEKVRQKGSPLSEFINFQYGFKTADDKKFISEVSRYPEDKPFIRSAGVKKYHFDKPSEYVRYIPEEMIKNAKTARPGTKERFNSEKIVVARMGKALVASYDPGGLYVKDAMLLLPNDKQLSLLYILGIINSRLLNYFYSNYFVTIDVLKNALLSLPIKNIDFKSELENQLYSEMQENVLIELKLRDQFESLKSEEERVSMMRQIESTDRTIDQLVYKLYNLTGNEIRIVEEAR
ncbi:N-6 DNA methylase [Candidatus Uhrbacteria bacterium]|nr:N-6 DNA methylase [Candidatus Uhrbacteria bacterium]